MEQVVDLYTLRCVAATLLWARHHLAELSVGEVRRVDVAVRHLVAIRPSLTGDLASITARLLSNEPDHHGARTIAAIDNRAELTNVDLADAAELAANLTAPARLAAETERSRQPELFDDDGDDAREPA
jgi:hypothetical protein